MVTEQAAYEQKHRWPTDHVPVRRADQGPLRPQCDEAPAAPDNIKALLHPRSATVPTALSYRDHDPVASGSDKSRGLVAPKIVATERITLQPPPQCSYQQLHNTEVVPHPSRARLRTVPPDDHRPGVGLTDRAPTGSVIVEVETPHDQASGLQVGEVDLARCTKLQELLG